MLANAEANPASASDNDKMITVLQTCFQDLMRKQGEQFKRQVDQSEMIHKAIKALKTKEPVIDKDTAFWNNYKTLADEYDREFQQKYGSDLDTTLIFAGLFSAVSSAFIIQIQPQFTEPGSLTTKVLLAQCMLYVSLFTTLLAALFAVLGKQWMMNYQTAGVKGTIDERGRERQRKLDSIHKWKFEAILQTFPLLLQLALLLFGTALSIYLWPINHSIALIALVFTAIGFSSYILVLALAIVSRDSPFQIPLAPFLIKLLSASYHISKSTVSLGWKLTRPMRCFLWRLLPDNQRLGASFAAVWDCTKLIGQVLGVVLEDFWDALTSTQTDSLMSILMEPSESASAVLWALDTSTDPLTIDLAAGVGIGLRWPLGLNHSDLDSPLARLEHRFLMCFRWEAEVEPTTQEIVTTLIEINQGQMRHAIYCGKVYCSLRLISRALKAPPTKHNPYYGRLLPCSSFLANHTNTNELSQLITVVQLLTESPRWVLNWSSSDDINWALHVIPSLYVNSPELNSSEWLEHFLGQFEVENRPELDESSFANYLCCINTMLSPMDDNRTMLVKDKRYEYLLPSVYNQYR
ncbi:hypothetical protein MSAN_01805500 [Mycena sanguinolenta]|uniref:DUF6535 domain-containing protein n=1 Tax=Mycena sanguinolenta TaxID=230812 RepID=A0A8H7CSJ7_9AGAR|nr:hypothetical protein MSAN_01805500 [Mycena sanguinolenta]